MKEISKNEWLARFEIKDPVQADGFDPDGDYTFYDNGAVADLEGNFEVTADEVKEQ
jgi:hypothetical protein